MRTAAAARDRSIGGLRSSGAAALVMVIDRFDQLRTYIAERAEIGEKTFFPRVLRVVRGSS
jgi:hypothetical protein